MNECDHICLGHVHCTCLDARWALYCRPYQHCCLPSKDPSVSSCSHVEPATPWLLQKPQLGVRKHCVLSLSGSDKPPPAVCPTGSPHSTGCMLLPHPPDIAATQSDRAHCQCHTHMLVTMLSTAHDRDPLCLCDVNITKYSLICIDPMHDHTVIHLNYRAVPSKPCCHGDNKATCPTCAMLGTKHCCCSDLRLAVQGLHLLLRPRLIHLCLGGRHELVMGNYLQVHWHEYC